MANTRHDIEAILAKVDSVPFWFHTIDFDGGITSPGFKTTGLLKEEAWTPRIDTDNPAPPGKKDESRGRALVHASFSNQPSAINL